MTRMMTDSANQFRLISYWKRLGFNRSFSERLNPPSVVSQGAFVVSRSTLGFWRKIISNNSNSRVMSVPAKFHLAITAAIVAMLVAACGQKPSENNAATQVAVKVNGSEISVHQVNAVLSRAPALPPEKATLARKEVVEHLVNQQLAMDQAIEKKLERTPDVLTAIESAKREILARAYLDTIMASQPKPTPEEIKKYYDEHPQLFANRRVFQIQELLVEHKPEALEGLRPLVVGAKSLDEMVAWLKTKQIQFRDNKEVRAAEQIPLEVLPKIAELKDGQSILLERPQAVLVMRVVTSQAAALDETAASPRIQQFLANERSQKAIDAEFKRLKAAAKIEYQGEFAAQAVAARPSAAQPESAKPDVAPTAAAPVVPGLEKGVAGLK